MSVPPLHYVENFGRDSRLRNTSIDYWIQIRVELKLQKGGTNCVWGEETS